MAFTFGGFGNQQQTPAPQGQQQQQTPAFGGFGATSTFGSTTPATGFGQQQQPQQQQGSLFGGFGSTNTSTPAFGAPAGGNTSTGGGLFGSQNNNSNTGTGAFGGGGGGFSFGQQSQPAAGGGLFGSQPSSTGAFGASSGGFGAAGGANNTNNSNPNDFVNPNPACPVPANGTADAPMDPKNSSRVLMWKDNRSGTQTGPDGKQSTITGEQLLFDNISALPQYWHVSPEELRVADYAQGRKTAPAASTSTFGGFGQSTSTPAFGANTGGAFGQQSTSTGGGLFGQKPAGGGLFGGAANTNTGTFGKPATPAFGASSTGTGGGLFGQNNQTQGTSAFGGGGGTSTFGGFGQQNQQQNKPTFSFGSNNNTTNQSTGGLFGQNNTASTGFGQQATQQTTQPSGFSFGQNSTTSGTTGGLFGQQSKPAGGLFGGAGTTGTDANKPTFSFGQTNTATQPSGGGLFGQQNNQQGQQQQQQPASTGLFGNLGQTSTFGQNNQQQQPAAGGGLFGQQNKPAGGLFGGGGTGTTAPSFSFGGGQQQQQQPQQNNTNTGGGLFGGSSLFGNTQNQQQNQQQQQPQQGTGLFGGGGSTFGATNNTASTGGGLFGGFGQNQSQPQQQQQPASTFSLGQSSFGGFGQSQNNQQNQSLFGQSQQQPQQQQQPLQALNLSIDQNPYGNNPIFANVQPATSEGPKAYDADQPKKQLPLHISYRGTPRSSVKINKLRGFAASASSPGLNGSRFGSPALTGSPLHASLSNLNRAGSASPAPQLNGGLDLSLNLPPQAFPSRPSVKKLIIDKKHRESSDFLFGRRGSGTVTPVGDGTPAQPAKERATFNPEAETADRAATPQPRQSAAVNGNKGKAPAANGPSATNTASRDASAAPQSKKLVDGDYYTKPDFKVLQSMSEADLAEINDFVVGRVGFGEICWLEPVDLTGLASLRELLGEVVVIEDREVMVYPGDYEDEKPEVGQGLNTPAVISLRNCWPLDRATREPLKDPNHQRVKQHVRKLEKKEETEYVDYEASTGTWTFKVAHFSRYGLDSDDEDGDGDKELAARQKTAKASPSRKKTLQIQAGHTPKKQRRTDSPVSDSTDDEDDDYEEPPPPQATLEDDSMTEGDETATERSYTRTPVLRSMSREITDGDHESNSEERRRKRSVAAPTPRFAPTARLRAIEAARSASPSTASLAASEGGAHRPIAQRLGLEPKKVAVMQASFFDKPRKDAEEANRRAQALSRAKPRRQLLPPSPDAAPLTTAPAPTAPEDVSRDDEFVPRYRPLRQWQPISSGNSLMQGKEGNVLDAGLMLGRSFRASFGPQGQLITVGGVVQLGSPHQPLEAMRVNIIQPTTSTISGEEQRESAARMLQVQHSNTDIEADGDVLPLATTSSTLRFHHFVKALHTKKDAAEASLWKLGSALFDEIDLALSDTAAPETIARVNQLRRTDAVSDWLRESVASSVEDDLAAHRNLSQDERLPATIFTLLTGNQIERAVEAALAGGDIRLATLLTQIGGDNEFREDVRLQIAKWRYNRADPLIGAHYRKIYELLAGNTDESMGMKGPSKVDTSEEILISEDLDWKRTFGLRFWYASFNTSIRQALRRYSQDIQKEPRLARPRPTHCQTDQSEWFLPDSENVNDVIYELLQLYADGGKPLEDVLSPRAISPSPYAYRQSWHLYQTVSTALRVRDFEDADSDGFSLRSQSIAENYADELEKLGMWQWAVFILLHLKNFESREKAVCELLARHVADFNANTEAFLLDSLSVPKRYLDAARKEYAEESDDEEQPDIDSAMS